MTSPAIRARRISGVDFSGARDAGKRMWLALGTIQGTALRIEECDRAGSLLGSGWARERTLAALRDFIASSSDCAFGLDFPFGVPSAVARAPSWERFVRSFGDSHRSAQAFKTFCFETAGRAELRRLTDREVKTPLAPYNLRLFRQTFYGIRDVLAPLVTANLAAVLPMQPPERDKAWILEICPASTLQRWKIREPYKDTPTDDRRESRVRILRAIERRVPIDLPRPFRARILDDPGGDALDSVIAAVAVSEALPNITPRGRDKLEYAIEGYVYA